MRDGIMRLEPTDNVPMSVSAVQRQGMPILVVDHPLEQRDGNRRKDAGIKGNTVRRT